MAGAATLTQHGRLTYVPSSVTLGMPSAETSSLAMLSMVFSFYPSKSSSKGATRTDSLAMLNMFFRT